MKTATGVTLVRNGKLIDGAGANAIPDAVLLIRDGIIRYAGPARDLPSDLLKRAADILHLYEKASKEAVSTLAAS